MEAQIPVRPGRVPLQRQLPRVTVVDKALLEVGKGNAVPHDVVSRRVVRDAQLEAIPVTLKGAEAPPVVAVAPGVDLLQHHGGGKHEEIQPVVDVVPQPRVAEDVALARAALAGEAVGALAVLARVAVAVRVEVEDRVVGGGAFELEARFVVVVGREALVVVVGGVARVDPVGPVD